RACTAGRSRGMAGSPSRGARGPCGDLVWGSARRGGYSMTRIWDELVGEADQRASRAAGFGRSLGVGKRPALLVIDVQYRTAGTKRVPREEAVKEFATACGEVAWDAIEHIRVLVERFRDKGWPVMYPHVA